MTALQESTDRATDLTGSTVLVLGGAGGVGEGVARALLRHGASVVVTSRSPAKLASTAAQLADAGPGTLVTRVLDVLDGETAEVAAELARAHGRLRGVVVAIGDWGTAGRRGIMDTTEDTWDAMIRANLTSQFRAFKVLVPLLAADGVLVNISGLSADVPFPGSALVAAANAANKSLTRTLAVELGRRGPRVHSLVLGVIRTRPRLEAGVDDPGWYAAEDVGEHVAALVAGTSHHTGDVLQYLVDPAVGVRTSPPDLR